ncbi:hypothetical protein GF352_01260 [archaeon]|nr:hypothetical protein [archaeon]
MQSVEEVTLNEFKPVEPELYFYRESLPFDELRSIDKEKELESMISEFNNDTQHQLTSIAEDYIKKFKEATECFVEHCDLSLPEILVFDGKTGPVKLKKIDNVPDVAPYLLMDNDPSRISSAMDGISTNDPFLLKYKDNDCVVSYYFEVPDTNVRGGTRPCAVRLRYYDSVIRLNCMCNMLKALTKEYTPILEELFKMS